MAFLKLILRYFICFLLLFIGNNKLCLPKPLSGAWIDSNPKILTHFLVYSLFINLQLSDYGILQFSCQNLPLQVVSFHANINSGSTPEKNLTLTSIVPKHMYSWFKDEL